MFGESTQPELRLQSLNNKRPNKLISSTKNFLSNLTKEFWIVQNLNTNLSQRKLCYFAIYYTR